MKYALLIYAAEKDWAARPKEEQGRIYNEYMAYSTELKDSGKMLSCEPLAAGRVDAPRELAQTVRRNLERRGHQRATVDAQPRQGVLDPQ